MRAIISVGMASPSASVSVAAAFCLKLYPDCCGPDGPSGRRSGAKQPPYRWRKYNLRSRPANAEQNPRRPRNQELLDDFGRPKYPTALAELLSSLLQELLRSKEISKASNTREQDAWRCATKS